MENNGTCGQGHGAMAERVQSHEDALTATRADQERAWVAIGARPPWKVLLPVLGLILTLSLAGAGVFAGSLRSAVDDLDDRTEKVEESFDAISGKLNDILVQMERIRTNQEHDKKERDRERERGGG